MNKDLNNFENFEFEDDILKKISSGNNLNDIEDIGKKIIVEYFFTTKYGYQLKCFDDNYYYSNYNCKLFLDKLLLNNNKLEEKIVRKDKNISNKYILNKPLLIIIKDRKEYKKENNTYSINSLEFHFLKNKI